MGREFLLQLYIPGIQPTALQKFLCLPLAAFADSGNAWEEGTGAEAGMWVWSGDSSPVLLLSSTGLRICPLEVDGFPKIPFPGLSSLSQPQSWVVSSTLGAPPSPQAVGQAGGSFAGSHKPPWLSRVSRTSIISLSEKWNAQQPGEHRAGVSASVPHLLHCHPCSLSTAPDPNLQP